MEPDLAPGTCKVITGFTTTGLTEDSVGGDFVLLETDALEYIYCGESEAVPGSGKCVRHTEEERP